MNSSQMRRMIASTVLHRTNINVNDQSADRHSFSKSKAMQQSGGNNILGNQQDMMGENSSLNKSQKGFLRVGDIVLLHFHERVFEVNKKDKKDAQN